MLSKIPKLDRHRLHVCLFIVYLNYVKSALPCLARLEWPTNNCTNIHQQGR